MNYIDILGSDKQKWRENYPEAYAAVDKLTSENICVLAEEMKKLSFEHLICFIVAAAQDKDKQKTAFNSKAFKALVEENVEYLE